MHGTNIKLFISVLEVPYQFLNNSSNAPGGSESGLTDTIYTLHARQTGQHIRAPKVVVSSKVQYIPL
jgi:hypothetical protein